MAHDAGNEVNTTPPRGGGVLGLKAASPAEAGLSPADAGSSRWRPGPGGRMAQQIVDEIENLGPTRVREIEAAQSRLTGIARELIGKGEVNILGRPGVVVP